MMDIMPKRRLRRVNILTSLLVGMLLKQNQEKNE